MVITPGGSFHAKVMGGGVCLERTDRKSDHLSDLVPLKVDLLQVAHFFMGQKKRLDDCKHTHKICLLCAM